MTKLKKGQKVRVLPTYVGHIVEPDSEDLIGQEGVVIGIEQFWIRVDLPNAEDDYYLFSEDELEAI